MKKIICLLSILILPALARAEFGTRIASITPSPMACMDWTLAGGSITTVNTAGVYELAAGTSALVTSLLFEKKGDAGVTYTGEVTRAFLVVVSGCMGTQSVVATSPSVAIFKNGNKTPFVTQFFLPTQLKSTAFAINGIVTLATGDYIDLRITSDDADDIAICGIQMTVTAAN